MDLLADEFEIVRRLIPPGQDSAQSYPCRNTPPCGCYHRVVSHSDEYRIAICTCADSSCRAIPVTTDDLIIYRLNRPYLANRVATALQLEPGFLEVDGIPDLSLIGYYRPSGGDRFPVYLLVVGDNDDFLIRTEALVSRQTKPFILFAPTPSNLTPLVSRALRDTRSSHFALSEILVVDGKSELKCFMNPWDLLYPFGKAHVPALRSKPGIEPIYVAPGTTWGQIRVSLHSIHEVKIHVGNKHFERNFVGMGMSKKGTHGPKPNSEWDLLRRFAIGHGYLYLDLKSPPEMRLTLRERTKMKCRRLSKSLKAVFGDLGPAISPLEDRSGWRTNFQTDLLIDSH